MSELKTALGAVTMAACLISGQAVAQTREEFRVMSPAGYEIAGDLALPRQAEGPVPAVILVSGSGAQDRDAALMENRYSAHRHWREVFTEAGVAVLSFDETGTGESGGEWAEMGLYEHAGNVGALADWLRTRPEINPEDIYILGHSEGGLIASLISAEDPDLAGLIYVAAPGRNMAEILEYQLRLNAQENGGAADEIETVYQALREQWTGLITATATLREGMEMDVLGRARRIQSPAIILQGWADWQVEAEQAVALAEAVRASGQDVDLHVFSDINHLLIRDPDHRTDYEALPSFELDPVFTATAVNWVLDMTRNVD